MLKPEINRGLFFIFLSFLPIQMSFAQGVDLNNKVIDQNPLMKDAVLTLGEKVADFLQNSFGVLSAFSKSRYGMLKKPIKVFFFFDKRSGLIDVLVIGNEKRIEKIKQTLVETESTLRAFVSPSEFRNQFGIDLTDKDFEVDYVNDETGKPILRFVKNDFMKLNDQETVFDIYKASRLNLGTVASAAAIYFGDHQGQWPRSLTELVPNYLIQIPREYITGSNEVGLKLDGRGGWYYTPTNDKVFLNLFGIDPSGKPYKDYEGGY